MILKPKRTRIKNINDVFISSFVLILSLFFIPWFRNILSENIFLAFLFFITSSILTISFYKSKTITILLTIFLVTVLSIYQIKTVELKKLYEFTPSELDLQIQRMNLYPPKLARLGYILERKKEIQILGKIEQNFFDILDINLYFPDYFSFLALPFVLYGSFIFINKKVKFLLVLTIYILLLSTITGVHGKFGPFVIFPILTLFIIVGFVRVIGIDKKI